MALAEELAEISRLVEGDDVETTLGRFVRRLVATVPDCDEAVMVVGDDKSFELATRHPACATPTQSSAESLPESLPESLAESPAADVRPTEFDRELTRLDGPMRDVLVHGEPHRITDTDERWPNFTAAMVATGHRSCLLLPVRTRGEGAGFVLLSTQPDAFADASYDVALLFALHAGAAFDNVQLFHDSRSLIDQLLVALETRAVIGQAQGLLMHRYGLNRQVAFEVLKRGSQNNNVKLRDLATTLVQAHETGSLMKTLTEHGLAIG
ncbi:hypothetical protein GCM10009630_34570 [Kribbella jejuensis]|uniref:ANTAR domain-containing protein n=2 Tax=Kribbella jejuensis TaxID=236068 RepID=A0A542DT77_9ACTN|nr:ANTAR domain-containing protein [Kribbella jejuensis]